VPSIFDAKIRFLQSDAARLDGITTTAPARDFNALPFCELIRAYVLLGKAVADGQQNTKRCRDAHHGVSWRTERHDSKR
jgi:hypothetical protein